MRTVCRLYNLHALYLGVKIILLLYSRHSIYIYLYIYPNQLYIAMIFMSFSDENRTHHRPKDWRLRSSCGCPRLYICTTMVRNWYPHIIMLQQYITCTHIICSRYPADGEGNCLYKKPQEVSIEFIQYIYILYYTQYARIMYIGLIWCAV